MALVITAKLRRCRALHERKDAGEDDGTSLAGPLRLGNGDRDHRAYFALIVLHPDAQQFMIMIESGFSAFLSIQSLLPSSWLNLSGHYSRYYEP